MRGRSLEDYLEAIASLEAEGGVVRVRDIGKFLGVKMPSVVKALKKLSSGGLVEHERYGYVRLTDMGREVARDIMERHRVLRGFFEEVLGVSSEVAQEDACGMEHFLSEEGLRKLSLFMKFIMECPKGEHPFIRNFRRFVVSGERCICGCDRGER